MRLSARRFVPFGLPALAACAVALVLVETSASQRAAAASTRAVSHRASAALVRHFSILRHPHIAAAQALPSQVAQSLSSNASSRFGLDVAAAQEAQPASNVTLWLVPGSIGDCVVADIVGDPGYTTSCERFAPAADQDVFLLAGPEIVGFVPDGNASVSLTTPASPTVTAPVVNNAYAAHVPLGSSASSAVLHYTNAAGAQTRWLPLPPARPPAAVLARAHARDTPAR
jgi:hypothetical protein